ncbi:hypothetical protein CRUP_034606, partial [Coryphaenoides rupestris]
MSSCSLDEKYFISCCQLFLTHSDRLGDGWSWEQHSEEGYLKKTSVTNADTEDDEACVQSNVGGTVLQYEYHVLFSCSFGMPVLYFRVFDLEGRSLCLEQVWDIVHPNYRTRLQQSPWNTITQQPFFVLHPCKTEEFMRPVTQAADEEHRKVNYVVTWLSVVGPLIGLDLPLSYSTLLHACVN